MTSRLFHISCLKWAGETEITLVPGTQCAEGKGVYFSEGEPRFSAAEGARQGAGAIFCLDVEGSAGWWRSKRCNCRNRPRTWRTEGVPITLTGLMQVGEINGLPVVAGRRRNEK
jgi:hypothetical protein